LLPEDNDARSPVLHGIEGADTVIAVIALIEDRLPAPVVDPEVLASAALRNRAVASQR
jgi:hypothetical protein